MITKTLIEPFINGICSYQDGEGEYIKIYEKVIFDNYIKIKEYIIPMQYFYDNHKIFCHYNKEGLIKYINIYFKKLNILLYNLT